MVSLPRSWPSAFLACWLLLMVALTAWTGLQAVSLVGKPFNGFLAQPLLYVSPYQLERWKLADTRLAVVDQLVAAEGRPLRDTADLLARARAVPVGTPLHYAIHRGDQVLTATVPTRFFTWDDFLASFGTLTLLGWEFLAIAMAAFRLRPDLPAARYLAAATGWLGVFLLVYMDFHITGTFARLTMVGYPMLAAGFLALALVFPTPLAVVGRAPWLKAVPWGLGAAMALVLQLTQFGHPPAFTEPGLYALCYTVALAANTWMMLGFSILLVAIAYRLAVAPARSQARLQAGIALAGAGLGLLPTVLWGLQFNAGQTPWVPLTLAIVLTGVFPLAIAYAIVRARLLDSAVVIRRSVLYLVFSTALGGAYVLVTAGMRQLGWGGTGHWGAEFVTTALIAGLALSLRDTLQAFIDRALFREDYDAQLALEEASRSMTALLERDAIIARVTATIGATLRPRSGAMLVCEADGRHALIGAWGADLPDSLGAGDPLLGELAAGEILVPRGLEVPGRSRPADHLARLGLEVAIPLTLQGQVCGALLLGPKQADTAYTERDLRLLRTLANQSAIALENARGVQRLQAFNLRLEAKVQARTHDLEQALSGLKEAQAMLVHAEKMAALGLLVGGVAHELNNPLTFILGSTDLLEERLDTLKAALSAPDAEAELALAELETLAAACREGAGRARAIVQNLRNFSRLDEFERRPVDLADCLSATAALVRPAFKDRVAIVLDLAEAPPVAGSSGHLNQVFMNIFINACQAIEGRGTVHVTLSAPGGAPLVTIADTGPGMSEAVRARIFEPFFTTKPPGEGTGLGLAICLGIMQQHDGHIEATSRPGEGTVFRLSFSPAVPEGVPHAMRSDR
jgi:signal transduction histidine kinase